VRDTLSAETVMIAGYQGETIEAYLARPDGEDSRGSVVMIHHMPGYDRASKEMVRRLAELGYDTICPNLYWRDAPGASSDDAAASARANGGLPDERVVGDVGGSVAFVRALETSNQRVGIIGFCAGGRQAVLSACLIDVDAAVDCYGAYVTGTVLAGHPFSGNVEDHLPDLRCPLLGLFGSEDSYPSPAEVRELERILDQHDKPYEFHSYDDAGHAFFAVDRPTYRVAAANDGWERIAAYFATRLSS
jgi:carboxymethylenebutenolidase